MFIMSNVEPQAEPMTQFTLNNYQLSVTHEKVSNGVFPGSSSHWTNRLIMTGGSINWQPRMDEPQSGDDSCVRIRAMKVRAESAASEHHASEDSVEAASGSRRYGDNDASGSSTFREEFGAREGGPPPMSAREDIGSNIDETVHIPPCVAMGSPNVCSNGVASMITLPLFSIRAPVFAGPPPLGTNVCNDEMASMTTIPLFSIRAPVFAEAPPLGTAEQEALTNPDPTVHTSPEQSAPQLITPFTAFRQIQAKKLPILCGRTPIFPMTNGGVLKLRGIRPAVLPRLQPLHLANIQIPAIIARPQILRSTMIPPGVTIYRYNSRRELVPRDGN